MIEPYYKDSDCTLYCGRAEEILPQLTERADLLLTDPPYGINRDRGFGGAVGFGGKGVPIKRRVYEDTWDGVRASKGLIELCVGKASLSIVWGGNFYTDILPQMNHWIFWDKKNTMPSFGDGELAWTNVNRNSVRKVTIEYNGLLGKEKERWHPTQKPLALMKWCVEKYAERGQLILDTFAGSCTTLVAAKLRGCRSIGIEASEKYCELAVKERLNRPLPLFDEAGSYDNQMAF